jgi:Tol biopolymer transport system component
VVALGPSGEDLGVLVADPDYWGFGDRVSWSADGSSLAFSASGEFQAHPGGRFGTGWPLLGVATSNGGSKVFPGAFLNAGDPVLAPDGRTAYFARSKLVKVLPGRENLLFKSSIWSFDLPDGPARQRTKWQLGFPTVPSSFSPDGHHLAGTRYGRHGFEAVAADLRGGRVEVLAREASEPTYSPDGSEVAFIRWKNWRASGVDDGSPPINELRIASVVDFPRSRLVLRRKKLLGWPNWDPSGSRLAFTISGVVENGYADPQKGDALMEVNADGTCPIRVFSDPKVTVAGSAWQPGSGREAGPISC